MRFTVQGLLATALLVSGSLRAQTVMLNVNFETGIPFSWTQTTADTTSGGFSQGSSILLSSEYFPIPVHSFFVATNDDLEGCWDGTADSCSNKGADRLILPTLDMTGLVAPRLQADFYYLGATFVYSESAAIQASIDGGSTWTTIKTLSGSPAWFSESIDLSAYAGEPSLKICFYYNDGGGWLYGLGIDNVVIVEAASYDLSAIDLVFPNPYELAGSRTIQGTLFNNGGVTIDSLTLNYTVDGGVLFTQDLTGLGIDPLESYTFSHAIAWNAEASPNKQMVEVWASNLNGNADEVPENDRLTKGIHVVNAEQTTKRFVLFEHFTSTNSPPAATLNPPFYSAVAANEAKSAHVSYHVWWPYPSDPYYNGFSEGAQVRVAYYNTDLAPSVWMDGLGQQTLASVNNSVIDQRADFPALFEVVGSATLDSHGDLTIAATLTSLAPYWGSDVTAHIAVLEEFIPGPNPDPNSNAEFEFLNVVRQMLPSAEGTPVTALGEGATQTLNESWNVNTALINPEEVLLAVFIQDNESKAILQAATIRPEITGLGSAEITSRIGLYPNPAKDFTQLYMDLDQSLALRIELCDATGRVIRLLGEQEYPAGRNTIPVDVRTLSPGAYFVRLAGEKGHSVEQFHVIR